MIEITYIYLTNMTEIHNKLIVAYLMHLGRVLQTFNEMDQYH